MAGSALMGAATARLLVTVGYPDRGEVTRGLSGLAGALAHFRGMVNSDSHKAAQKSISSTTSHLKKLQSVAENVQSEAGNFERSHQARYIRERLAQFADASRQLETMTSKSMSRVGAADMGLSADMNQKLFSGVALAGDEYSRLQKLADNFYKLGIEGEKRLINELEDSNRARRSAIDLIDREIKQKQAAYGQTFGDPTKDAQFRELYGEAYDIQKATAAGNLEEDVKALKAKKAGIEALMKPTSDLLNLTKGLHTATVAGERERQKEVRASEKQLQGYITKAKELIRQDEQWARNLTQNLNTAISNFRNVLQQSVITLTLFYYKINQVVEGIKGFQQELMNAQSIFQTTNETLYGLSNQIVEFGSQFGISYNNAAKGLYQFASAGLSADDSMKVLNDTLKLSMAVQGDHNTISKLTTQVIFGFGLEMDEATAVTDKFAHAINKSLIEYQDLASAIKFSMPFFVSTGQSLDTLLGALQVLTNRALEAGIAGRGLRQSLAEFTQHADDNQAAFRKLGVEILDAEGNMKSLTNIAQQFNDVLGEDVTDMEVMMALMEDLNVRGATAFVHLVQNADEFQAAVTDLQNSAGSAHEMAMIQQQGLEAQLTRLKNAFLAPFLLTDEISNSVGVLNKFELVIQHIVADMESMIYDTMDDGSKVLTDFAVNLREGVLQALIQFGDLIKRVATLLVDFADQGMFNISMLKLYFLPLSIVVGLFEHLSPSIAKVALALYILNKTLMFSTLAMKGLQFATFLATAMNVKFFGTTLFVDTGVKLLTYDLWALSVAFGAVALAASAFVIGFAAMFHLTRGMSTFSKVILGLAAALAAFVVVATFGTGAVAIAAGLTLAGASIGAFASALVPEGGVEADMGAYATSLPSMATNTVNTGGANSYNPSAIYVKKLNYSESNMNEQYESTTSYQAGVTP
jgi:TP901 family phage tail tape measure protein